MKNIKIVMLAKSRLNSIEITISKALTNNQISHMKTLQQLLMKKEIIVN